LKIQENKCIQFCIFESMITRGLFILFLILTALQGFAQVFDPDFIDKISEAEQRNYQLKSVFKESSNYAFYDLVYQRMEWVVDPAVKYIAGKVTSYFTSQIDELSEIEFDLNSLMTVDSVKQHNTKLKYTLIDNKLIVQLINALASQELDSVHVYYRGEPEKEPSGFGSFTISKHSGVESLWTLSEPYGAMEWWPCKQSLNDKIDSIDIIVTCPELYRTASNGILVSEEVNNGLRTMHWKHRYPIATYLVAIAVTNYDDYSDTLKFDDGREMKIVNFVYPEYLETAKNETTVTADLIKFYSEKIDEYPFLKEKYGHAQFGWGGGMEHQTMSFMGNLKFDLQAHELAHQWFGDYITLGTWQDIWLNEGFATYMTGLSYEYFFDGDYWPQWKTATILQIVSAPDGSVFVNDTTDIYTLFSSRLSYSKGAYLLHMLRWILGDEHFFEGMQEYFNDPKLAAGFARNSQFVRHMEIAGDTSLTEFFNDWYYGEGYPEYSAIYTPVGEGILKIRLSQTTTHNSVDFFEMPVPVRVYNSNKTDSMDFRLNHTLNNQEFLVEVNFDVAELVIDPDKWLISKTSQVVKVDPEPEINDMVIYPNPFNQYIFVFAPSTEQIISSQIITVAGTTVRKFNGNQSILNCSGIAPGTYILHVQSSRGVFNRKIVKK